MKIEPDLYRRLLDQAHAVATYHQYLIDNDLAPGDDVDGALECAADHVSTLAGYKGVDREYVSDTLRRGLRAKHAGAREVMFCPRSVPFGDGTRKCDCHGVSTVSTFAPQKYHALCTTCGYVGRSFESKADADVDGDEHEIAVGDNRQHHNTRTVES